MFLEVSIGKREIRRSCSASWLNCMIEALAYSGPVGWNVAKRLVYYKFYSEKQQAKSCRSFNLDDSFRMTI